MVKAGDFCFVDKTEPEIKIEIILLLLSLLYNVFIIREWSLFPKKITV